MLTSTRRELCTRPLPVEKHFEQMLCDFRDPDALGRICLSPDQVRLFCRWVQRNEECSGELERKLKARNPDAFEMFCEANDVMADGNPGMGLQYEHENQGIAWLWASRSQLKMGVQETNILRQLRDIRFVGVAHRVLGLRHATAPIYCVRGRNVSLNEDPPPLFTYEAWSWQSGVQPRIVR